MGENITFYSEGDRFNFRAAAILLDRGRVLVSRDVPDAGYTFLPGGRVQMLETAETTICRELSEELGIHCTAPQLLWVTENRFYSGFYRRRTHEICYFYLVTEPLPAALTEREGEFYLHDNTDQINIPFRWVPLDALPSSTLRPAFLRQALTAPLPTAPVVLSLNDLPEEPTLD